LEQLVLVVKAVAVEVAATAEKASMVVLVVLVFLAVAVVAEEMGTIPSKAAAVAQVVQV
jgi:hypothetical protein